LEQLGILENHTHFPRNCPRMFSHSRILGFPVSRFLGVLFYVILCCSRFLGFSASRFLGFSFSRILGFSVICLEVSEGFIPGAAFFKPIIEIQSDSILEKLIPIYIYMTSDHVKDMSLLSWEWSILSQEIITYIKIISWMYF
jgi:hypothetical protein